MLEEYGITLKKQIPEDIEIVFLKSKKLKTLLNNIKQKKKVIFFINHILIFLCIMKKLKKKKN